MTMNTKKNIQIKKLDRGNLITAAIIVAVYAIVFVLE